MCCSWAPVLGILLLSSLTELNYKTALSLITEQFIFWDEHGTSFFKVNSFTSARKETARKWERKHTKEGCVLLKEGFWIRPVCVLVFLCFSCTLRPRFAEVKNKSPVSQPSTYSGFSEVVVVMAQSQALYKLISWSHYFVRCFWYLCVLFSFPLASCLYCFQAQVAFLQGERKGQENMKQDLVRRIKMLEYALKQERWGVPVSSSRCWELSFICL